MLGSVFVELAIALGLMALMVGATEGLGTLGFGCGLKGRRYVTMTSSLALLLALVLWLVIDLDFPRRGLIRINQSAMIDLKASNPRSDTTSPRVVCRPSKALTAAPKPRRICRQDLPKSDLRIAERDLLPQVTPCGNFA